MRSLRHHRGIVAENLNGGGAFMLGECHELFAFAGAVLQAFGADHLGNHVGCTEAGAQLPEGLV